MAILPSLGLALRNRFFGRLRSRTNEHLKTHRALSSAIAATFESLESRQHLSADYEVILGPKTYGSTVFDSSGELTQANTNSITADSPQAAIDAAGISGSITVHTADDEPCGYSDHTYSYPSSTFRQTALTEDIAGYRWSTEIGLEDISACSNNDSDYDDELWSLTVRKVYSPSLTVSSTASVNEGASTNVEVTYTDPGGDRPLQNLNINWGDGASEDFTAASTFGHEYSDGDANYPIVVTANYDGGSLTDQRSIHVANVAPTLDVAGDSVVDEGALYEVVATATDPGQDTITDWHIDWGDGTSDDNYFSHVYEHGGETYHISATASDEDGTWIAQYTPDVSVNLPTVSIQAVEPTAIESSLDDEPAVYVVTRDHFYYGNSLTLNWNAQGGAALPEDLVSRSGTVTFDPGESEAFIYVTPYNDSIDEGDEDFTVSIDGYGSGEEFVIEQGSAPGVIKDPQVAPWSAKLEEVDFGSNVQGAFHQVLRDGNAQPYGGKQWLDLNWDGDVADTGEHGDSTGPGFPISYTRSTAQTPVKITMAFKLKYTGPADKQFKVKAFSADGAQGINFAPVNAQLDQGYLVGSLVSDNPIASTVDLKTLALKWQVSEANANPPAWQDAGISTNTMYVSFGDPGDAIRTVLDVGTRNAKGLSTTSQIGSQIWSDFIDRSVKTWDGYELHYWGSVASSGSTVYDPNPSGDNNVAGLLRLKDGRCGAWAQFFVDVWAAQDVIAHVWSINPISNFYPAPAGFPNFDGFVVNAMPGQGNANPARAFFDHAVVKFDNVPAVYDPSYGKYYANDQAWRDAAESEFQFRDTFNILPNTQYQGVAHAPKAIDSTFTKI